MHQLILADIVVALHFMFIVFVLLGGLLALRWRKVMWVHLPAVIWALWIEFFGGICPLTPLELWLRRAAGEAGYQGGFIEHYLLPLIYPAGLTREIQIVLGLIVIGVNLLVYAFLWRARVRRKR